MSRATRASCVVRQHSHRAPCFRVAAGCLAGGIALVVCACTDVGTSPTTAVALAFDTLPSPAVVYGDTLRDINGLAAKLTGHAYNSDGREIIGADIKYHILPNPVPPKPPLAIVSDDKYLIATGDTLQKSFTVRAEVDRIPSALARTVDITFRPDSADRGAVAIGKEDTLYYAAGDAVKTLDAALALRVISRFVPDPARTDTVTKPVKSWLVKFRIVAPVGDDAAKADSLLVDDTNRPSTVDTTSAEGSAGRKIRIRFSEGAPVLDSVVVEAIVRYKGADVRGAPIRFKVRVRRST